MTSLAIGAVAMSPVGQMTLLLVGTMSIAGGIVETTVGSIEGVVALTAPEGRVPTEGPGMSSALMMGSSPTALVGGVIGGMIDGQNGMAVGIGVGYGVETIGTGRLSPTGPTDLLSIYSLEGYAKSYLERYGTSQPLP